MPRQPIFFYGSLRDPELLAIVIGRSPQAVTLEPAALPDHGIRAVAGESFPCVVESPERTPPAPSCATRPRRRPPA